MTLQEYYGFPEGTNCTMNYYTIVDFGLDTPINGPIDRLCYSQLNRYALPDMKNCKPTSMYYAFQLLSNVKTYNGLQYLDTSECTDMTGALYSLPANDLDYIRNWDTSNVTSMNAMFQSNNQLIIFDVEWDTSKVKDMQSMFYSCNNLVSICALDCSSVEPNKFPFASYMGDNKTLTTLGGFINLKTSQNNSYGLTKLPNLTYESCINILNGLYDFTGNGETPNSSQGKLKVNQAFMDKLTEEDLNIAILKGWQLLV